MTRDLLRTVLALAVLFGTAGWLLAAVHGDGPKGAQAGGLWAALVGWTGLVWWVLDRLARLERPRAVRLGAVQEDRHGGDGDVRRSQREQGHLPPGCVQQTVRQPLHEGVVHRHQLIHPATFPPRLGQHATL